MSNIFDYLDWRSDIPFEVDPFNEVDNLIFSMLAYVDYEGVLTNLMPDETISIDEAEERFFSLHTDEEIMAQDTFTKTTPYLLRKMKGTRRFGGVRLGRYVNEISEIEEEQMAVLTLEPGDGTVYISFRGTDSTIVGWKEDFNLSFLTETKGQKEAARYLRHYYSHSEKKLRIGGHSKGGNFAVYSSAFAGENVQKNIKEVWSNDGPGLLEEVVNTPEYQNIVSRIHHIIPAYSVFGLILESGYDHQIIESSGKGIMQHDGLTWQVTANHFNSAPSITEESAFLEKTIRSWTSGYALEEREKFVNLMYELIQTSGAETFTEFNKERFKNYVGILKGYDALVSENQKIVKQTLQSLLKSGAAVLAEEMPQKSQELSDTVREKLTSPEGTAQSWWDSLRKKDI